MADDDTLTAATGAEILQALAYALRFDHRGNAHRRAVDSMAQIAAETLTVALDQADFVVMKRPAMAPPRTPGSG